MPDRPTGAAPKPAKPARAAKKAAGASKIVPKPKDVTRSAEVVIFDETSGRGMLRVKGLDGLIGIDLAKTKVTDRRYVPIKSGTRVNAVLVDQEVSSIAADIPANSRRSK